MLQNSILIYQQRCVLKIVLILAGFILVLIIAIQYFFTYHLLIKPLVTPIVYG